MKNLIFILALALSQTIHAEKFFPAQLIFVDGKVLNGLASMPSKTTDRDIAFKASEKDDKVQYKSDQLKTVVFYFSKDTVEYDRVKTYNLSKRKITDPVWLEVLKRGYVTLYFTLVGGNTIMSGPAATQAPDDKYWLCMRPGEEAATIVSWWAGYNANDTFKRKAPKYFADYPELVQKIEEKTYKWKDIMKVVNEYNDWKQNEKK